MKDRQDILDEICDGLDYADPGASIERAFDAGREHAFETVTKAIQQFRQGRLESLAWCPECKHVKKQDRSERCHVCLHDLQSIESIAI